MIDVCNDLRSRERKLELLKKVKCFILDLDGTFYLGDKIYDGSIDFLRQLEKMNIRFKFFTNNSSKNTKVYIEKITKMGYPLKDEQMLISNHVIIEHLNENMKGKGVYLLGTEHLKQDFIKGGINLVEEDPDIVVVGFDTTLAYERVSKACHYIRNGAIFYGVNPDLNCPVEEGFIPDCGSICAMITTSTGVTPTYFGKPTDKTLKFVLKNTGLKEEEIAFVGDRLYTDIAIANGNHVVSILVLTGETKEEDLINSETKPKLIFQSLKEIKEFLENM